MLFRFSFNVLEKIPCQLRELHRISKSKLLSIVRLMILSHFQTWPSLHLVKCIAKLFSNQAIKAKLVRVITLVSMGLIKYLLDNCVGVLELHPGKVVWHWEQSALTYVTLSWWYADYCHFSTLPTLVIDNIQRFI